MAIKITLDSFLAVLKRSNLLTDEQVASALEKFRAAQPNAGVDAKPFAEFLVRNKVLTVWQAEKVLQGKHKGFFLGRYRLLSLLGKGGMSSVYLAEHTVMKRRCALKVLPAKRVNDASYLGRFHREAQAVAALDHPNIVRAYDVDMTTDAGIDIHFLSMEFVQGKSLLELLQEKGSIPVRDAVDYVRQSAEGLDHAHRAGLVHRDIKPGNLLLTSGGVIKILDLGLARFFNDEEASLTVQHDEKVLGTADYISPEQAIDSHKVDHRTDIYSLGCTLYFLLCGHPPFNSGSLAQRLVAHQNRPAPPITNERPEVPASLVAVMDKMMAKKEADRYQTAQEVAQAMASWLKQAGTGTTPAVSTAAVTTARPPVEAGATTAPTSGLPVTAQLRPAREKKGSSVIQTRPEPAAEVPVQTGADDPFGFLTEAVPPVVTEGKKSGESATIHDSSKSLSPTAKETANLNQSPTAISPDNASTPEEVELEKAFNPELLNLEIDPDDEGLSFTPSDENTAPTPVLNKPKTKTLDLVSPRQRSQRLTIGLAVATVFVLAAAYWAFWGGSDTPTPVATNTVATVPGDPAVVSPPATNRKQPTPYLTTLEVGPDGHFATLGEAVSYVQQNFQALTETDARTIELKSGVTFTESVEITSSSKSYFPRNVTIKSSGTPAAILQGNGKLPALTVLDVESLTIDGISIDGNGAATAVRVGGYQPFSKIQGIKVQNFTESGVLLENLNGAVGQEFVLDGLRVSSNLPDAVGIRAQAALMANVKSVQLRNCRCVGSMKAGIEVSGFFWKAVVSDSIFALCQSGIRFEGGLIDEVTLVNNSFYKNQQAVSFAKLPDGESKTLRLQQLLFSQSQKGDVVVESGDLAGLAENLLAAGDGRRLNRTDRKDPAPTELDVFSGDGLRGATFTFGSVDPTHVDYLKVNAEQNVTNPAPGAKSYVGAVSP